MDSLIIRNDDVCSNTVGIAQTYSIINSFLDCKIYSCTTVFCKDNIKGSVYPELPMKDRELDFYLNVDKAKSSPWFSEFGFENVVIASHGLWHFDHTKVDTQLKKASIISSCRLLHTDIFVPPFNKWDEEMELICISNGIQMIKSDSDGWKSFEHNKFDKNHKLWYLHSWRWDAQRLKDYLSV